MPTMGMRPGSGGSGDVGWEAAAGGGPLPFGDFREAPESAAWGVFFLAAIAALSYYAALSSVLFSFRSVQTMRPETLI